MWYARHLDGRTDCTRIVDDRHSHAKTSLSPSQKSCHWLEKRCVWGRVVRWGKHALRSNEDSWEAACLGHQQDLQKRWTRAARNLICVRVCVEQLVLASSTPVAGRREKLFYGEPDSNLSRERHRGQWHTNRPFLCELVTSVHRGLPTSWLWKMLTQTQTSQRIAWLKAAEILPCRASLPFLCSLLPSFSLDTLDQHLSCYVQLHHRTTEVYRNSVRWASCKYEDMQPEFYTFLLSAVFLFSCSSSWEDPATGQPTPGVN